MNSATVLKLLERYESRNITFRAPEGDWPIVWERARGCQVWDAEGRKYLDLTAAFGVAAAGHANPRVVAAGRRQMGQLLHAMGDVHPHALKAQLARELSRITFERWAKSNSRTGSSTAAASGPTLRGKTILTNSGFEAVEAALKTAQLATGRPGVIAFAGAYHGLGYGALNATHRSLFREPFCRQLREFGTFVSWPEEDGGCLDRIETEVRRAFKKRPIGAILVEPIQVRGGVRIPSREFLPLLRRLATEHESLLILDEIYTGFGRAGRWFACEHTQVVPDLICLGKALTGGFPLSACVGRADVMDAWPPSEGEAIHTSTFLGHPVGCAMALAQIEELRRRRLVERSASVGAQFLGELSSLPRSVGKFRLRARGLGLLVGLEWQHPNPAVAGRTALALVRRLLQRGLIVLPEGEYGEVVSFTPPLTIREADLRQAVRIVREELDQLNRVLG
ncbi:MAG TPA: aspartate aminotransferase family protein [Verrucomicrobiales bacterium]|nr:aspartate aminotransferase family protein [Verrucomicrobiales bacterium]